MKKWTKKDDNQLKKLAPSKTATEIAREMKLTYGQVSSRLTKLGIKAFKKVKLTPKVASINDEISKLEDKSYRGRYKKAVEEILMLKKEREINLALKKKNLRTYKIKASLSSTKSEATAVVLLSDWHYEEVVKSQAVNFLNKYDESIAKECILKVFQTTVKYIKLQQNETTIKTLVMALLGDFITGGIHDELKEGNPMLPGEAIWKVQNHIASGINFILENTDVSLVIPCSTGNHGRTTEKQRVSTDFGNSYEWLMYKNLEAHFTGNERVKFIVNEGYHTYVDIYDYTLRFHHGHAIKYGGGVGGIYITVNKAIGQWNKSKKADLDCFGHFHQMKNGGNFITNGSMIGWNAYAIRIKADFEKPKQAFFMVDKKYFVNLVRPIILNGR